MKIAIDARMWDESGIGRYLRNLVYHLAKLDKKNDYFILLRQKNLDIKLPKNFTKIKADFSWYGVKEQWEMPGILSKLKLDLVHFPHFNVPILYSGKFVVTIHDLIHQHFQQESTTSKNILTHKIKKYGYKKAFNYALTKSKKIITPTASVKHQLTNEWSVAATKIEVTHEAVEEELVKLVNSRTETVFAHLREKFSITKPYLFYVGNAHPHKNIERLILVFRQLRLTHPELQLVLSGKENYFWKKVLKQVREEEVQGIIYTGYITDEEMAALYKNALAFVLPSLEEGFGIPVLEAMAADCPVVASDIPAVKEVGGEVVFLFDASDEVDMRRKLLQVVENSRLRKVLSDRGLKHYKKFSWENLAKQTLEVYLKCV
jgi:glycosyltransferase involved in cell wall biosynthesis